jgi:hypothetical protein
MASASAHIVLTGKVKKTKIARDGTAVVVKKSVDNAQVEERFPKRRMRGKRKANDQMIPVEDVIRGMKDYAQTIEPEVQRRVDGVNRKYDALLDEQKRKYDTLHNANARADRQIRKAVKVATAARAQTSKAKERTRQALSFAEAIAQHMNA